MYVNYLHELAQYLQLDQLIIPQRVKELVSPLLFCTFYYHCTLSSLSLSLTVLPLL